MSAASLRRDPNLFTILSSSSDSSRRKETFFASLFGQAILLGVIVYLTSFVIHPGTPITPRMPKVEDLPLIFSGQNGGGGGNFDPLPSTRGTPPRASLDTQIVPPTVIVPKEMPKLPVKETVVAAPELKFPPSEQIGDPNSKFSRWLSNGPGGPGGIGDGCCDGIGSSAGPHVGNGPPGIYPAGRGGVTVPEVIFNPEPAFSEEARKVKHQGIVLLLVVVGKDGHTYDIKVAQSLGMGLDEKAIEAVNRWRFRPATKDGEPVSAQIAVQVDFRLY
jgi:protein TonB